MAKRCPHGIKHWDDELCVTCEATEYEARIAALEERIRQLEAALRWSIDQLDGYDERDGVLKPHYSPPEIDARALLAERSDNRG